MKQTIKKTLKSNVVIYFYIIDGVAFILLLILFFLANLSLARWVFLGFVLGLLVKFPFHIYKYALTENNTIEFFNFIGRLKNKSIHIQDITAIEVKSPTRLSVEYYKHGDSLPSYYLFQLKSEDISYLKNKLLNCNPTIEVYT